MKNIIFMSPNFPTNYWQFCRELKNNGMNVLGIGDQPYDELTGELKNSLNEYYKVGSLENYDEVYRAVAYFIHKYGLIDWLERDNDKLPPEYWDEYILIDAPAWGASEVYQEYSSGEARNQFLVCWPDRIVEISFDWDWDVTPEIISIAAAALKSA